jgi:hypothetical protein
MSNTALAHLIHRFGTQVRINGELCLCSNGDPALSAAFAALGWSDPMPVAAAVLDEPETATVESPERAVLSGGKAKKA